jgi:hypothetical protein
MAQEMICFFCDKKLKLRIEKLFLANPTVNQNGFCKIPFNVNGTDQYFCIQNSTKWFCETSEFGTDECNRGEIH